MIMHVSTAGCHEGDCLPLAPMGSTLPLGHTLLGESPCPLTDIAVGTFFYPASSPEDILFACAGHFWLPSPTACATQCLQLAARRSIAPSCAPLELRLRKEGFSLASITLSDKGAKGLRADVSGPLIISTVSGAINICFSQRFIIPDDACLLQSLLARLALEEKYDMIITTGGTGVGVRDVTPQATAKIIDIALPGMVQAMVQTSLMATPHAMLSRALAGIAGKSLILNLPGSPGAVKDNLGAVLPALEHTLRKINGDQTDCGG